MNNKVKSTRVKEVMTRDAKLSGLAVAGILAIAIVSYLIQAFPVAFDVVAYSILLGMVPVMYVGTVRMRAKAPSSKFNRGFAFNQVREFCRKGITNTRFIAEKTGLPISEIEKIQESYFQKFNKKHGIFHNVASGEPSHSLVVGAQLEPQWISEDSMKTMHAFARSLFKNGYSNKEVESMTGLPIGAVCMLRVKLDRDERKDMLRNY